MIIHTIADGYGCSAGLSGDGWYAAALLIPDRDRDYAELLTEPPVHRKVRLLPGKTLEDWSD
ncbi:MAG: hypothetical protein V3S01_07130 [Dehalococcoidia bacterium]